MKFFVQVKKTHTKSSNADSHDIPTEFPSCVLVHNDGWNDYSSWTWFSLFYYNDNRKRIYIGELKLMHSENPKTYDEIQGGFEEPLNDDFCSLGIETSYYYNLQKEISDKKIQNEILEYLRDCAFNTRIYETYRDNSRFKESLIRDMSSQEALNAAEFILNSDNPDTAFSFRFTYHPKYDINKSAEWDVSFLQKKPQYLRTVGIIGENGVGKTMLLTSFVEALLQDEKPSTLSSKPHFQSCVAICSSDRDSLLKIKGNKPKYISCCLRQKNDETYASMLGAIEGEIMERPMLYTQPVAKLYYETLQEHLGRNLIGDLFSFNVEDETNIKSTLNREHLKKLVHILSSGQLQIFELITYLYAHIHLSSLIIFDEPEIHMHPSLIMCFMPLLNKLLREFKSFSIICTHSPLVIRELVQKNVYRMTVNDDMNPSITRVGFRTFGEDISILYRNIFEYDESKSYYRQVIKEMILSKQQKHGLTSREEYYQDISTYLEQDMELGLSGKSAIRDLVYDMIEK